MSGGYQQLEIYQLALKLAADIHQMTLTLPKIETYEEGSQIRRSSKSVAANLVEGYGRRQYKNEFLKYGVYASASCDETKAHLDMLHRTGSLDQDRYTQLYQQCCELGRKIYRFRQAVIAKHNQSVGDGITASAQTGRRILEEDAVYLDPPMSNSPDSEPES